jgi:hypothetical protein
MTAIWAEELDLLVPELLPVTIKFAFALGAGHPKNFRHRSFPLIPLKNRSYASIPRPSSGQARLSTNGNFNHCGFDSSEVAA